MGRYTITLYDGSEIGADDARFSEGGKFLEFVTRYQHEKRAINSNEVKEVRKENLGYQGGMRFNGEHDTSFSRTEGSI